jgi:hypothetical protein
MNGRDKHEWERRVDGWCAIAERIMLRTLLFGCFTVEVCRFVRWMWIAGPH